MSIFRTAIEPEVFHSGGRPCRKCAEEGMGSFSYQEVPNAGYREETLCLCAVHLSEVPEVIRLASAEDAAPEARRRAVEIESAIQWTRHLGRPVYPGERVDALAELLSETERER